MTRSQTPASQSHSLATLQAVCNLAQQCISKGNSLIKTAATSPRVEQFCGEEMQVDELPGAIFALVEFMDDTATQLNSVRDFYSGAVASVVQIQHLQGLCFHGMAWDFAHRIWGHIHAIVDSVWACNPVGEEPAMQGFRFLINREAILSNLEEIRTTLKGLKPIEDTKRFRLELQAEFLQGLKVHSPNSTNGHDFEIPKPEAKMKAHESDGSVKTENSDDRLPEVVVQAMVQTATVDGTTPENPKESHRIPVEALELFESWLAEWIDKRERPDRLPFYRKRLAKLLSGKGTKWKGRNQTIPKSMTLAQFADKRAKAFNQPLKLPANRGYVEKREQETEALVLTLTSGTTGGTTPEES